MPVLVRPLRPQRRSLVRLSPLIVLVAVIAGGLLVLVASASASKHLDCRLGEPTFNTVACGPKKQVGEHCAAASHVTPSPLSAGYEPGSTSEYRIRFQVEGMVGCDPAGIRTVTYFQELRNGPAGPFVRNGKISRRATNVRFLLRDTQAIPLNCSMDAPGSAVRTLVRLTWHPSKGWGGGGNPPDEVVSKPTAICTAQAGSIGHAANAAAVYLNVPSLSRGNG